MYDYDYDDADYADDDQGRMSVYDSIFVYFGGVYLECNNVCMCVCSAWEFATAVAAGQKLCMNFYWKHNKFLMLQKRFLMFSFLVVITKCQSKTY